MNWKSLALISTSIVALGFSATASHATPPAMGEVEFGVSEWFDTYRYGSGNSYDYDWASIDGAGRVNIPYNQWTNIQLDFSANASLDQGGGEGNSDLGNAVMAAHFNWRDSSFGQLGIFGAAGRLWGIYGGTSNPAFMAGIEGQYYCNDWTFYGQLGYMDSDGFYETLSNAGFARGVVSYYASPRLKLSGGLAYIDGEAAYSGSGYVGGYDSTAWAWHAGVEYWFGKSVPVSAFLKYDGRQAETHFGSGDDYRLTTNQVWAGVSFHWGGDDIKQADRQGASLDVAPFDWFRLPDD